MLFYDSDVPGPNLVMVRLFLLEREGVDLDVHVVKLTELENRSPAYLETVNARGEVPVLRLDDGTLLTEITAICEFFDEIAVSGNSLVGNTAQERAVTRMWARRTDLEICQPLIGWWRGGPEAEAFYKGHRILGPEARPYHRKLIDEGLDRFDRELVGKQYLCGDRYSLADILLYSFYIAMGPPEPRVADGARPHFEAWLARVGERPAAKVMLDPLQLASVEDFTGDRT